MIRVRFEEPTSQEWVDWRKAAEDATEALITYCQAGGRPEIKDDLYKRMRAVIFEAFFYKCAYCETRFIIDQSGDVEHFRPKAGVVDEYDHRVEHPGYYWLAYDWRNLLPSCSKCNRLTITRDGRRVGKGERFPVAGQRANARGEEANEQPLFLHPCIDDPEQHLMLDPATGILSGLTQRGRTCVDLLDLNREGLPEARKEVYDNVRMRVAMASNVTASGDSGAAIKHVSYIYAYHRGEVAYSHAGRIAIKDATDALDAFSQRLRTVSQS
jgi:uncharacterized protein (TIGR02646 family)